MKMTRFGQLAAGLAAWCFPALALMFMPVNVLAAPGDTLQTLTTPMELPVEVEIELSPAGSLKQAALWKELIQLLYEPYSPVVRRPGFGVTMPPLNTYPLDYNFLTGQPLRLRTSDGEVSWDLPGPMFDQAEVIATNDFNTPTEVRTPVGHLVACPNVDDPATLDVDESYQAAAIPATFCTDNSAPDGSLVIYNPGASAVIPPNGTIVAVSAVVGGILQELDGVGTTATVDVAELEIPVNEEDFLAGDTPAEKQVSRGFAEVLGKALFWDMQVGSDGIQACGSCHFHAGVDNRTRGQLNPATNAGDLTLQVKGPNEDVVPSDFPFHKLADPEITSEETNCGFPGQPACAEVIHDANDVMSSMGVSRFKQFVDIPPIGTFLTAVNGVAALPPDLGLEITDPVPVNEGFRRVEPRHTPTFHSAAFNFDNFWDGRARFNFNGGSVFGPSDPTAHIFIDDSGLEGATMGHFRDELVAEDPEVAAQPVRVKFSSLASQAVGPPLSDFEMSFIGRNWPKIGKKLLQAGVVPLANQLVDPTDSVLGPWSNQGGSECVTPIAIGKPGLCISYPDLIQLAYRADLWQISDQHLAGSSAECVSAVNGVLTPAGCDPFDGYVLSIADGSADAADTDEFNQMEANFSAFFGLAVQMYEELTIPDDTPADRFFDANPQAGHGIGEPGDQAVLYPTLVADLIDDGLFNGTAGTINLIPDDPNTPEYDGFGPDEVFGFDLFAGGNLTAALAPGEAVDPNSGINRNPLITNSIGQEIRVGSNPFTRSAKCMLCHLGPEQTDHSINISHGVLKNNAEFEFPTPPLVADPTTPTTFIDGLLPAPEPSGSSMTVGGLILAEEVGEGPAQDAVEVEPRNFLTFDDPATPWDDRIIAQPENFAFGDQGVYNIGLRPSAEDAGRGGLDAFGWTLSLSALTLKNIAGPDYEPCDGPLDDCVMANFDPFDLPATFEETGDGETFPAPGDAYTLQSINPGFERDPINPLLPEYMVPWIHSLPAGELHPQIDEMAGMVPNTLTPPNGGPAIEFPEIMFGADFHCAAYDPATFGSGPPNFGWGPPSSTDPLCPNNQSGVTGNFDFPVHGTWPVPNRVLRDGAFKAPPLRNVEMTGPYFHTGSFLTLRQVVDFYFRGGDFPITNADSRDPNINDLFNQTFSFGPTQGTFGGFDLATYFDCIAGPPDITDPVTPEQNCGDFDFLAGSFADGLPDTVFLYDEYPDSDHHLTPELPFASREAAIDDAKNAIVKFMLALSDQRVKYEKAPFDRPEIFVPVDGTAPENTAGRAALLSDPTFRHIPAVGAAGNAEALPNFLNVSSVPAPGQVDQFDTTVAGGSVSGGVPTISDALRALQIAVGSITPTADDLQNLDVYPVGSPDGVIDVNDALFILQRVIGLVVF